MSVLETVLQAHLDGLQDGVSDGVVTTHCEGDAAVLHQFQEALPYVFTCLRKTERQYRKNV